jgi:hypothetical protein
MSGMEQATQKNPHQKEPNNKKNIHYFDFLFTITRRYGIATKGYPMPLAIPLTS